MKNLFQSEIGIGISRFRPINVYLYPDGYTTVTNKEDLVLDSFRPFCHGEAKERLTKHLSENVTYYLLSYSGDRIRVTEFWWDICLQTITRPEWIK